MREFAVTILLLGVIAVCIVDEWHLQSIKKRLNKDKKVQRRTHTTVTCGVLAFMASVLLWYDKLSF